MSMTNEEAAWINSKNRGGKIFIIATPCSGAAYLNAAIKFHGHGRYGNNCDLSVEFLTDLMKLYNHSYDDLNFDPFHDHRKTASTPASKVDINMRRYLFQHMLFKDNGYNASGYSTSIGLRNEITVSFIEFLRDLHDSIFTKTFKIVWLARDVFSIAKEAKGKAIYYEGMECDVEKQMALFRENYDLDDVVINYDKLMEDPISVLKRLKVNDFPNKNILNTVTAK